MITDSDLQSMNKEVKKIKRKRRRLIAKRKSETTQAVRKEVVNLAGA